ncbi:MAG TPA: histidine kinase dimerization/phospho-acceptor domain-containing protein, partial [Bacillota bacterium]|nr:histidine kinase dimerization/phospho-acceptor domain-containing protein [Bacillota bacterium]
MIYNSIRWRVQAWHGLILVIVLAGFGFTAYQVARDSQLRRIDQELEQRLATAFRPRPEDEPHRGPRPDQRSTEEHRPGQPGPRRDPAFFRARTRESIKLAAAYDAGQTNSFYLVLWQEDGTVAACSPGTPADVPRPEFNTEAPTKPPPGGSAPGEPAFFPRPDSPMTLTARTRGEFRELYRHMPFGDCILVGRSLAPDLAAMHRLALWLAAAGSAILVLGLAGGWWVASRAIRPIEDISATALKIAAGDLSQRINAADTDSELGRLAGVLNSTFARLEAAFTHQNRFTSDAAHELRTPVSVILTQTQTTLSRERSGPEYRETLQACQRAAQRMRKLTESLLELARLDAGQEPMKRDPFDLARVARDSVELVRPLASERGIKLQCDLPPVHCLGDAERIGQVATNLLSNAIHFNREHGEVRISAQAENGTAYLT